MEQIQENKSEVKPPKEPDKPKKELTEEQRQKQKKMIVYPLMALIFSVAMWLIFAPSGAEKEQEKGQSGFNTDVPAPTDNKLADDKLAVYEQEQFNRKQAERREQMQDLASMFGSGESEAQGDDLYDEPEAEPKSGLGGGGSTRPKETIYASANAYRDMNRTLGNFYEQPKEDPEKEEMRKELEELREMAYNRQTEKETADEQLALLEKSYQLAAKYMPQNQGQPFTGQPGVSPAVTDTQPTETYKNGKAQMNPVGQVRQRVVSGLAQPMSDTTFIAEYAQPRNLGFLTAVGTAGETEKNTIKACIHDNQTITDGQAVRLRLLEPMRAGETVVPKNAIVTGMGKIQGERLGISITSLEYRGLIIPVELTVMDSDGQEGIFIPGSMEIDAIREIAANLGGNLGTTINLNQQSAGDQLLTDLGKGAIQGTSQYIAKKMRTIKVHLKAGYNLMLYQKKQ